MLQNEVGRLALLGVCNLVKPAMASQAYIPALTHICFDGVNVMAYNDITALLVRSPIELDMCIPGDQLIKALNSFGADKVLLQPADGNMTLCSGRSKIKLPILSSEDFPFEIPPESDAPIKLSKELLAGIEMCLVAVGNDPTHPAQVGVTMESGVSGAALFSTDNFTLSRYTSKLKIRLPADVPVIMPTFFCQQLLNLAKAFPNEEILLDINAGSLTASFGEQAKVFTRQLVDLEAVDFNKVLAKFDIDRILAKGLFPIPDDFDAAFGRALLVLGNEPVKTTRVTIHRGTMELYSSSTGGESTDSFGVADKDILNKEFYIDPILVSRAGRITSKMASLDRAFVCTNEDATFVHLIAHCTK